MSQPSNFQLSLELTNILNPLAKALTALGCSLTGLDGSSHSSSSSDTLTELHLASSLGRHRVSESLAGNLQDDRWPVFTAVCFGSTRSPIPRSEWRAARIVRRALTETNPAWLSMVIQVSVLGFAHEAQGLARGIAGIKLAEVMSPSRRGSRQRRRKRERKRTRTVNGGISISKAKTDAINRLRERSVPLHRVLHLWTNSGFSTVVVWCYNILGISVDEPRVFVQDCGESGSSPSVSLLDAVEQREPLSQLRQVEEDPVLEAEDRTAARGFLRRVLSRSGAPQAQITRQAYWIAACCIRYARRKTNGCKAPLINIVQVIFAFARVYRLEDCSRIPLSPKASWALSDTHYQPCENGLRFKGSQLIGDVPDTITSFNILSHLLLGTHAYTKDYLATAALISACGWSIYLDSLTALDAGDMHPGTLHITLGVPCRMGERKLRIVDGPTDVPVAYEEVLSATVAGHFGHDAFSAVPVFEWDALGKGKDGMRTTKWQLGFRDKQEMCLGVYFLHGCHCDEDIRDRGEGELVDKMLLTGRFNIEPQPSPSYSGSPRLKLRYPAPWKPRWLTARQKGCLLLRSGPRAHPRQPEQDPSWFFYVSKNVAARWLALDRLDQLNGRDVGFAGVVRARTCCVECACLAVKDKSFVLL
ncbi:hypothetical protein BDW69DRAFT_204714 [Aspergillus filifer]